MGAQGVEIVISVNVKRKIGGTEVELGVSRRVAVHNENERRAHYDKLGLMLNDQFDHFIRENVIVASEVEEGSVTGAEIIPADELIVDVKGGKPYYAIKGGRYTEHGVRIWKEVLQPTGLLDDLGNNYSLVLFDWKAKIEKQNGALKVVKLWQEA